MAHPAFNVWRSGTLFYAQRADQSDEFYTSTDEADALEQAGYEAGDQIAYGQPVERAA